MALPNLGPLMSLSDSTYTASAGFAAGMSGMGPDCGCPGFDSEMLSDPQAMVGRWVRSPKKFVGWDTYMEFFGLSGDKALQETEEPQEHVILEFSKEKMRILHRLCWRDGLDCEYTVPIDDSVQPVPPAMVAKAASSWKVNDLATWVHAWDEGDGNPLHRGLRTEQKLHIAGTNYTLRYWRNLIRPREIRVNVEVTYADTGKYAVHTQRFFHKIDVDHVYSIASLKPSLEVEKVIAEASVWTHNARAVRLVVLPHASNMKSGWQQLDEPARWEMADPFPSAGRSSGPYLSAVRHAAREAGLWICCGVTLRQNSDDSKKLLRCVALIGADGWLHGLHADSSPANTEIYASGSGDWPATQRARPIGVYDTEIGRVAMQANAPDDAGVAALANMGAELVVAPPAEDTSVASRAAVNIPSPATGPPHGNLTRYAICGPDALDADALTNSSKPVVVTSSEGGLVLSSSGKSTFAPAKRTCGE